MGQESELLFKNYQIVYSSPLFVTTWTEFSMGKWKSNLSLLQALKKDRKCPSLSSSIQITLTSIGKLGQVSKSDDYSNFKPKFYSWVLILPLAIKSPKDNFFETETPLRKLVAIKGWIWCTIILILLKLIRRAYPLCSTKLKQS